MAAFLFHIMKHAESRMTNMISSTRKPGFLFGIDDVGEKNIIYTLSVYAGSPSEAITDLKVALVALEERRSHFAEGENNTMMIGNVAATSRYKRRQKRTTTAPADQSRQEGELDIPRTVFPLY
ncbi:hypothetical protein [Candidatus Symbiopectobacterium sp.]|uniref:hypothetical protein n=1 Tax=Candidatus Symbiopectobacterium sp. TaxID=2816440 RepID=UPI0025B7E5C6|nr:hypothetical protein [Candidatus Symbiopectobacterium sp.]